MGKGSANAGDVNDAALYSLGRVLRDGRSGFYALVASPRTQAAVVKQYAGGAVRVYDFSRESRELVKISELMDSEPERKAYIFLNFHLALWDVDKWDINAVRRLNFSRNALSKRNRTLIFCLTPEADALLNRRAYDFYDYIKLFFRFKDEEAAPEPETVARPEEQSIGVNVTVDFSLPGEELLALAISLGNQAQEFYDKARYADALTLLQKQCEIREQILGTNNPDTAETYNGIGFVYDDLGDYASASEWLQKALRIRETVLGTDHPDTATTYSNIAGVYKNQGNYVSALEWYQKALRIYETVLGADHPYTATTYNNIGLVYHIQGDHASALEWYQKALRIYETVLGTDHPYTAVTYHNIGQVYKAQGDYASALKWYQEALGICERVLGVDHPDTAHNIGALYFEQGDFREALKWLEKVLAIHLQVLGTEHPRTKSIQEWLDALSSEA
ncbi:MAG: tetratricopeptide repeat protein [Oscillibacter sp.]|nr:tetratricopeptide repeat protein [Oscillibacter sp.]